MTDFTETRSMLKKLAMKHGAETDIGHDCHNILEMTENHAKSADEEQKRHLTAGIVRAMADLDAKLKKISQ